MTPRRVLHLIDTGGPGGAETVFCDLVAGLPTDRWESLAVIPWSNDWLESALEERGLQPTVLTSESAFDVRYLRALRRLIRSYRPHVVQTHLLTTAVYAAAACRLTGTPVVSTFHGHADAPESTRFRSAKFRIIDRDRSRFVFVSRALRDWFLATTSLSPGRTRTVYNGLPTYRISDQQGGGGASREELGLRDSDLVIGALGNVRESKDYLTLLHGVRLLNGMTDRSFVVAVAGDKEGEPDLTARLEEERARLGLENQVRFLGFVSDTRRFLNSADIYVLSSSREGFSLSTVEAMAAGLPVVATRCGGPEEILEDGKTGRLVPVGDPQSLARAMLELMENPQAAEVLGVAARKAAASNFDVSVMVSGYEAIYDEVVGRTEL